MSNIFEIIPGNKESKDSPVSFSLGIKMKIGQFDTVCSITEFLSKNDLMMEIKLLNDELAGILRQLESFQKGNINQGRGIDDNASPQEIWEVFSNLTDNTQLVEQFNSLSELKRRELADYIFANCNMFSGKGAFFSAQYIQETAMLTG